MRAAGRTRVFLVIALPVCLLILALVLFPTLLGRWASNKVPPVAVVEDESEIQIELQGGKAEASGDTGETSSGNDDVSGENDDDSSEDGDSTGSETQSDDGGGIVPGITISLYDKKLLTGVDFEEYIKGVVAAEMPISFELEALKAQAVAARTYAARKLSVLGGGGCSKHSGADLCADSAHCQAYMDTQARKKAWGGMYDKNEAQLVKAVDGTRGQVITYGGKPIEAFFHSTSGGWTEDVENVFSETLPYLRSVASRGEESAPKYTGEARVGIDHFVKTVNARFKDAKLEAAKLYDQLEVVSRTESGRVAALRVGGAVVKGTEIRGMFSLNSTHFYMVLEEDSLLFKTIGFGHGVGMSQVGANQMAIDGDSYETILYHYYTGTKITPIL